MAAEKQKPVNTLRDGACKATIWANSSEKGVIHSVSLARTFKGADDQLHDSNSFSGSELLRIARLAEQAYDDIVGLRADNSEDLERGGPS